MIPIINTDSFSSMPLVRLPLLSFPFLHQASLTVPQHSHSFIARLPESILALLLTYSLYAVNSVSKQLKFMCSRIYKNGFISHHVNLNCSSTFREDPFISTLAHPNPVGMPLPYHHTHLQTSFVPKQSCFSGFLQASVEGKRPSYFLQTGTSLHEHYKS